MNARLEGLPVNMAGVRGLGVMAARRKRETPEVKRTAFRMEQPKLSQKKRSGTRDALELIWRAADDLYFRLRDLRRRQRTGPVEDIELVSILSTWSEEVILPQMYRALSLHLAITAWHFVTGKNDVKTTVERAMLHRQDDVELNLRQLEAVRNRSNLEPQVRAQLIYNALAEGSDAAVQPDANTRRKGALFRLIRDTNPYILDK